jgi:hypothetical protein
MQLMRRLIGRPFATRLDRRAALYALQSFYPEFF